MTARPVRRILVPTDFSDTADLALGVALDFARAFGARIDIAHVSAPAMVLPPPIDVVSLPALFPDSSGKLEEAVQARVQRVRAAGLEAEETNLQGNAAAEIVRHAQESGTDLIVMGTHGRSGLAHAVMGSVAERVVHKAHCPVLVVPLRR
jgi:universal stress protein A